MKNFKKRNIRIQPGITAGQERRRLQISLVVHVVVCSVISNEAGKIVSKIDKFVNFGCGQLILY